MPAWRHVNDGERIDDDISIRSNSGHHRIGGHCIARRGQRAKRCCAIHLGGRASWRESVRLGRFDRADTAEEP